MPPLSNDYHLEFSRGKATEKLSMHCYWDDSWGLRKMVLQLPLFPQVLTGPVSCCAKKQSTIALSTTSAEYVGLFHAVQEAIWSRHLLKDLSNQACKRMIWLGLEQSIFQFKTYDSISAGVLKPSAARLVLKQAHAS